MIAVSAFWFWPRTFRIPDKPIAAVTVTDRSYFDPNEQTIVPYNRSLTAEEYCPLLEKVDAAKYKLMLRRLKCMPRYSIVVTFTDGKQIELTNLYIERGNRHTRIWSPALEEILADYFDGQSGGCQL